jgi:hypothetical protein
MERITFEPAVWELLTYRAQYDALRHDLKGRGFDVEIAEPMEERSADGVANVTLLFLAPELVVHVATYLGDHALDILETALITHLIGKIKIGPKSGVRRKVQIIGSDGSVLREVELPEGDHAEDERDE